jgi:hypothetical protein
LSDSSTYDNTTLAALGLTPGSYTFSWTPSAETADDTFVINIGTWPAPGLVDSILS